jgi:hypothetical protein
LELLRGLDLVRQRGTLDFRKSEIREVMLGGCGQEIERFDAARFGFIDGSLDEHLTNSPTTPRLGNSSRAQERKAIAACFDAHDTDEVSVSLRDNEVATRVPNADGR